MTSMLLTDRYDFATSGNSAAACEVVIRIPKAKREKGAGKGKKAAIERGRGLTVPHSPVPVFARRLTFLAAVARSNVLFLGVRRSRLLDHRPHQLAIRLDPVGDHLPLVAVPLLELDRTTTFMVGAGHLQRLHESGGAQLLETGVADLQVLDAPAHLFARQRLLAILFLRLADRLDGDDAMNHAAVVVDGPDTRLIFHFPLALGVDVLLDVLHHREVGAG